MSRSKAAKLEFDDPKKVAEKSTRKPKSTDADEPQTLDATGEKTQKPKSKPKARQSMLTTKKQSRRGEEPEPRSDKVTKPRARAKRLKSKKVRVPKTDKVKKVVKPRQIDTNSTSAEESGLNLSVARVKNVIDDQGVNRDYMPVIKAIRKARGGHFVKLDKEGAVVKSWDEPKIPLSELPADVKRILKLAKHSYTLSRRTEYERQWLKTLASTDKKAADEYKRLRKEYKKKHDDLMSEISEEKRLPVNIQSFNTEHYPDFYKNFDSSIDLPSGSSRSIDGKAPVEWDEYKKAINCVGKLKIRFGSNSKVFITAFLEMIIRSVVVSGLYNCFARGNKIVKIRHVFDDEFIGHDVRFSAMRLVQSLDTYKNWHMKYQKILAAEENDPALNEDSNFNSHPFALYIGKIFKYVKFHLANGTIDTGVKDTILDREFLQSYFGASLGQDLKKFCSDIIVELLNMMGIMINESIQICGVKTVTDDIIKTIIIHIYTMYGMNSTHIKKFMGETIHMYNKYIVDRREDKKKVSKDKDSASTSTVLASTSASSTSTSTSTSTNKTSSSTPPAHTTRQKERSRETKEPKETRESKSSVESSRTAEKTVTKSKPTKKVDITDDEDDVSDTYDAAESETGDDVDDEE